MICETKFPEDPGIEKIVLARTLQKSIPPRTKEISLARFISWCEVFILDSKFQLRAEPCFSVAREGLKLKKTFSIEMFIPELW